MAFREEVGEGLSYREMRRRRLRDFLMVMSIMNPKLYIPYHPLLRMRPKEEIDESEKEGHDRDRENGQSKSKPSY